LEREILVNANDWGARIVLNHKTRVWDLTARGPAALLLHFLKGADKSVLKKLEIEAAFDEILSGMDTENPKPPE
jgi:hypothetical protein